MDGSAPLNAPGGNRHRSAGEMVACRRRRFAGTASQRAHQEGVGRRHNRALSERRAPPARQWLSDAPALARLPGQYECQARPADQADRSTGDEFLRVQDVLADSAGQHDGGKSWAQAALQEPLLPKAFTRFCAPWRWDGEAAIL